MAWHDPDATRNVSVVPELPENKNKTAKQMTHRVVSHGTPSRWCALLRGKYAASEFSSMAPERCRGTVSILHRIAGSTSVADRRLCGTSLQTQRRRARFKNASCLLQRQQRPKSVVIFFGLPGNTYDGLVFTIGFWPPLVRRLAGIPRRFFSRGFRRTFGRANCKR